MLYSEAPARTSQKRVNHTAPQFADMGLNQKQKIIAAAIAALHTQQTELEWKDVPGMAHTSKSLLATSISEVLQ